MDNLLLFYSITSPSPPRFPPVWAVWRQLVHHGRFVPALTAASLCHLPFRLRPQTWLRVKATTAQGECCGIRGMASVGAGEDAHAVKFCTPQSTLFPQPPPSLFFPPPGRKRTRPPYCHGESNRSRFPRWSQGFVNWKLAEVVVSPKREITILMGAITIFSKSPPPKKNYPQPAPTPTIIHPY